MRVKDTADNTHITPISGSDGALLLFCFRNGNGNHCGNGMQRYQCQFQGFSQGQPHQPRGDSFLVEKAEKVTGSKCEKVNLAGIEKLLDGRGEILKSEVYFSSPTILSIDVTQRKPVVRFENETEGYYADRTGFLFPLLNSYNVPIVTGIFRYVWVENIWAYPKGKRVNGLRIFSA